jgi:hypothetical protein
MSSFRKSDDILSEWRAIADRATPPPRAPHGSASGTALRLGLVAAVALLIVAAVLGPRVFAPDEAAVGGSPSANAPTAAVVSTPTTQTTPTAETSPAVAASTFTTNGLTANWHGFDWTPVSATSALLGVASDHRVISWAHGYATTVTVGDTPPSQLWTSPDGLTWTRATLLPTSAFVAVADGPLGLLAVAQYESGVVSSQALWTSQDGIDWFDLPVPEGLGQVTSLAGNASGYVATAFDPSGGFAVARSNDGIHWSPVAVEGGLQWDDSGPTVQAANGRLFLMGGLAPGSGLGPNGIVLASTSPTGQVWWSDDGTSWTRSTGLEGSYGAYIDAASDALLLHTNYRSTPGGVGFMWSYDGGKSWQADPDFGPIGQVVCQGECGIGPDGAIGSNGSIFLAVKNDGRAWTSTDGKTWQSIPWGGGQTYRMVVLPRGVLVYPASPDGSAAMYGTAK